MTDSNQRPSPLTLWLDGLGRFNLFAVFVYLPVYLFQRREIPNCGHLYSLASLNRFSLTLLAILWIGSSLWDVRSLQKRLLAGSLGDRLILALIRLLWQLPGLCLAMLCMANFDFVVSYAVVLLFLLMTLLITTILFPRSITGWQPFWQTQLAKSQNRFGGLYFFCWLSFFAWFVFCPKFVGAEDCAQVSAVKANMHTFHTVVETFRVDNKTYPASLTELYKQANREGLNYWKDISNPFSRQKGYGKVYLEYSRYPRDNPDEDIYQLKIDSFLGIYVDFIWMSHQQYAGLVLYQYLSPKSYRIYGTDRYGRLIQEKGRDLALQQAD